MTRKNTAKTPAEELSINHGTEDTLLAVQEHRETGVRAVGPHVVLHPGDVSVRRMKLVQPTSAVGTPGSFVDLATDEEFHELVVVPVKVQATRTLWPEGGFSRGSGPDCASENGVVAVDELSDGRVPLFPGQFCSRCAFFVARPWEAPAGQRICHPGYDVLGPNLETLDIVGLRLHGTSNRIAGVLGRPGVVGRQLVSITAKRQTGDRGSWFTMVAAPLGPVTAEQAREVEAMLATFQPAGGT